MRPTNDGSSSSNSNNNNEEGSDASRSLIESLKRFNAEHEEPTETSTALIKADDHQEELEEDEEECTFCLNGFKHRAPVELRFRHKFHDTCILE